MSKSSQSTPISSESSNSNTMHTSRGVYSSIIAHCEGQLPNEACGLLVSSGSDTAIDRFIPIPNCHPQPLHSFAFDPAAWATALYELELLGQRVIGYYHSHPTTPPFPSHSDATGLPGTSSTLMLILSFASATPEARAYRFTHGALPHTPFSQINLIIF